jgi:SAM-dependent methyltransferase
MDFDSIRLVTEQVQKYGLLKPFVDIVGTWFNGVIDPDQFSAVRDGDACSSSTNQRPFDHIANGYLVLDSGKAGGAIEDLPYSYEASFGTVVCLNVIEHVQNPFRVFAALYNIMKKESLLIVETFFSSPYLPSPIDYWRYSPDCLRYLGERASFQVLECGWWKSVPTDDCARTESEEHDDSRQLMAAYVTLTKGKLIPVPGAKYELPQCPTCPVQKQKPASSTLSSITSPAEKRDGANQFIGNDASLDILRLHRLLPDESILERARTLFGPSAVNEADTNSSQQNDRLLGEYYAQISKQLGRLASDLIFKAQWNYYSPEWFDHRHHFLNPERFGGDFWAMSADLVLLRLPLEGRILNLCSGDGFYDYHFFSHRASEVVAVEKNRQAYQQALDHHGKANIRYVLHDVLTFTPLRDHFDVVVIRGAIEHFSADDQQRIFKMAWDALKPGGWFCGDTPANPDKERKKLQAHENEWADEAEMRDSLSFVFSTIETLTFPSRTVVNLFWQARKPQGGV